MPRSDLQGLILTRSERIIVVALSYLFCAPLIYHNGKLLLAYIGARRTVNNQTRAAVERQAAAVERLDAAIQHQRQEDNAQ